MVHCGEKYRAETIELGLIGLVHPSLGVLITCNSRKEKRDSDWLLVSRLRIDYALDLVLLMKLVCPLTELADKRAYHLHAGTQDSGALVMSQ